MKIHVILLLSIALASFSCEESPQPVKLSGEAQGTYYQITYFDDQGRDFQRAIDSLLAAYNLSVSIYEDSSVISRFNYNHSGFEQDEIFLQNTLLALWVAEASGGAFDPTVGPLVEAWGFGREGKKMVDDRHLDSLMEITGYELVEVLDGQVVKTDPRVRLDYNGIAKGYAVDLIGAFLQSREVTSFLVDVGGEVLALGEKPGGESWTIGIEQPTRQAHDGRSVMQAIQVRDEAVATSGNYRRYYEKDGQRYSHTINPQTGRPVDHNLLSVTVVANNCALADAWATAFMVMGAEKTLAFVENNPQNQLEVYLIIDGGQEEYVTEMCAKFAQRINKSEK